MSAAAYKTKAAAEGAQPARKLRKADSQPEALPKKESIKEPEAKDMPVDESSDAAADE